MSCVLSERLASYRRDGIQVLPLPGEFDLSNEAELEAAIAAACACGDAIVLDLSDTQYIDSTVLTVLVRQRIARGKNLRVVLPLQHRLRRIFEITSLDTELRLFSNLDEALVEQPTAPRREAG